MKKETEFLPNAIEEMTTDEPLREALRWWYRKLNPKYDIQNFDMKELITKLFEMYPDDINSQRLCVLHSFELKSIDWIPIPKYYSFDGRQILNNFDEPIFFDNGELKVYNEKGEHQCKIVAEIDECGIWKDLEEPVDYWFKDDLQYTPSKYKKN